MKVTTKVMAVLWALVLAGLWLPQVTLAGYCPDSGNCCETDADCAGEGEQCLDPFGACETSGVLCDDALDCGGHCAINVAVVCGSDADCAPFACNGSPKVPCVSDENCTAPATCEPNPCVADEACVKEPAATGRCTNDDSPCASDGDCPAGEYCVRPGNCDVSGAPCEAGYPDGRCSTGAFDGQECRADADCAHCSGDGPAIWCDNDSDCRECSVTQTACFTTADCLNKVCQSGPNEGLFCFVDTDCDYVATCVGGYCDIGKWAGWACTGDPQCNVDTGVPCVTQTCEGADCVSDPVCLVPNVPEGLCGGVGGSACQDNGDCDGVACVFTGSCTAGQCEISKLPCTTDPDCGVECSNDAGITDCTVDTDCGTWCAGAHGNTGCTEDEDCGLACSLSGLDCTTNADCRTECFDDGVSEGWACPNVQYCVDQGYCEDLEGCECKLFDVGEACEAVDTCDVQGTCDTLQTCNINDGCTTAQHQVCTNQRWKPCDSDGDCTGCALGGDTCAVDADCQDVCGVTGIDCAVDADCNNVCQNDPSVVCTSDLQCPDGTGGFGPCVKTDTCQANTCAGTCEAAFVCKEVATGKCTTRTCVSDTNCADLGAEPGDYTCSGDIDCCTGTCGVLQPLPDPRCLPEGGGDCESCYAPACLDNDDDGYGYPGGNGECPNGVAEDCDDAKYAVNPGATEAYGDGSTCSDGLDNDCNGDTDDADSKCDIPVEPPPCTGIASASTGDTGTGGGHSGWYLFLLAGVILIGAGANRVFGNRKE